MKLYSKRDINECPRCGEVETEDNILFCHNELAVQTFRKLDEWMVKATTIPKMSKAMKQALLSWKAGWSYSPELSSWMHLVEALYSQERLGWQAFVEG